MVPNTNAEAQFRTYLHRTYEPPSRIGVSASFSTTVLRRLSPKVGGLLALGTG